MTKGTFSKKLIFIFFIAVLLIGLVFLGSVKADENACDYDYNQDTFVNSLDFAYVLQNWSSGSVSEILQVLRLWGSRCSDRAPLFGYAFFSPVSELPLEELREYTNTVMLAQKHQKDYPSSSDLQKLKDNDFKAVVKIDKKLYSDNFSTVNVQELQKLKQTLDPFKDVINNSIFVLDEPYASRHQLTYFQVENLVGMVKDVFFDYKMYVNFVSPAIVRRIEGSYPGIPANIDIVSTDIYPCIKSEDSKDFYMDEIKAGIKELKDLAPGKPIFFAARGHAPFDKPECGPKTYQIDWDYQIYQEEDLDGLFYFFWEDASLNWYGSSHFPEIIEKQREIGKKILDILGVMLP